MSYQTPFNTYEIDPGIAWDLRDQIDVVEAALSRLKAQAVTNEAEAEAVDEEQGKLEEVLTRLHERLRGAPPRPIDPQRALEIMWGELVREIAPGEQAREKLAGLMADRDFLSNLAHEVEAALLRGMRAQHYQDILVSWESGDDRSPAELLRIARRELSDLTRAQLHQRINPTTSAVKNAWTAVGIQARQDVIDRLEVLTKLGGSWERLCDAAYIWEEERRECRRGSASSPFFFGSARRRRRTNVLPSSAPIAVALAVELTCCFHQF